MFVATSRFGSITVRPEEVVSFPLGLVGYAECQRWVLLADSVIPHVGWLQCISRPEVAVAVISPRRFLPDYAVRVTRSQLAPLELSESDRAYVLNVLARNEGRLTVNLRAPLIINLDRRVGRQVVTSDEQPVRYELASRWARLRRTA